MSNYPTVDFSRWFRWQDRAQVSHNYLPGVYLLARFEGDQKLDETADPLDSKIVYIGHTTANLSGRWSAFESEAFGTGGSHSGAKTYREKQYPNPKAYLNIAAMVSSPLQWSDWSSTTEDQLLNAGLTLEDLEDLRNQREYRERRAPGREKGPLNGAWVKFVERKLILDFVLKWGILPECNKA